MTTTLIRDLPAADRPRERLRDAGPAALSSQELLAILLRVGVANKSAIALAHEILAHFHGLGGLARASFGELCGIHGLGEAKAAQILAAVQLGIRAGAVVVEERPIVRGSDDIANLMLAEMSLLEQERVRVIRLDSRNRVMGTTELYQGSVHTAQVRIGELFRDAIRANASAIAVVHNHPSGDPMPSAADIQMTREVVEAGKLLDIDVHDHLVIAGGRFASLRSLGLGFPKEG